MGTPNISKYYSLNVYNRDDISYSCPALKLKHIQNNLYGNQCTHSLLFAFIDFFVVNGNWSPWTGWSVCSKICINSCDGFEERRRTCTSPVPNINGAYCEGDNTETKACTGISIYSGSIVFTLFLCFNPIRPGGSGTLTPPDILFWHNFWNNFAFCVYTWWLFPKFIKELNDVIILEISGHYDVIMTSFLAGGKYYFKF